MSALRSVDRYAVTLKKGRAAVAPKKDRISLCTFTFVDGRRCRTPRQSGHSQLCCFHARKEAQARAAEELGQDISSFFSGSFRLRS